MNCVFFLGVNACKTEVVEDGMNAVAADDDEKKIVESRPTDTAVITR